MKLNTIIIRKAIPDDALQWANMLFKLDCEVEYTTFESGERSLDISKYKNKIISTMSHPRSVIFLAIDSQLENNGIVGYISVEAFKNNRKAHVSTAGIGVLSSHYSTGIANQLVSAMIEHARQSGLRRIEAHIAKSNHKSISLAKKFGFIIEGIKREAIRINDTYIDEYLMAMDVINHGK